MPEAVERSRLSQRENEILELAIKGMTDMQIALQLELSPSTVNSYWVRIRGKLGQLSRTELVSSVLRQRASEQLAVVQAQSDRYAQLADRRGLDEENLGRAELHRAILDALADPVLATDEAGVILYVNAPLANLFGYKPAELKGQSADLLLPSRSQPSYRELIADFVESEQPLRVGVGKVLYGRTKVGQLIRVTLALSGTATSQGSVITCLIRDFVVEIDNVRRRISTDRERLKLGEKT